MVLTDRPCPHKLLRQASEPSEQMRLSKRSQKAHDLCLTSWISVKRDDEVLQKWIIGLYLELSDLSD